MLDIAYINTTFAHRPTDELLQYLASETEGDIAFSTSFSVEDQVLTDMLHKTALPVRTFTLDTGRLPSETYEVLDWTRRRYGSPIEIYAPEPGALNGLYARQGANGFYHSLEQRRDCCRVRKIDPLKKALADTAVWITGLRRAQADIRSDTPLAEWDETFGLIKINPLASWNDADVWAYVRWHRLQYNTLYDEGYASIGCAPCSRAIESGEDPRAGRWWWEQPEHKECGLHLKVEQ